MKIEEIQNSEFIKSLSISELIKLSKDLNSFILENVSKTGGHLSPNLGTIDLTIALLRIFDPKKDIIIYDVGHQCYAYKILTGRAKGFKKLRKKGGITGFQCMKESLCDKYEAGHSSTSLSAATGFAIARDLDHKSYNVISIIGDGSFANGLAYEALNHIGSISSKQIIILNDNTMSISKNVGAVHNFLDSIRGGENYFKAKSGTKKVLRKLPLGKQAIQIIDKFKTGLKRLYVKNGSMFNDLGIEYYGPINGHDFNELDKYLKIAKRSKKSVILHVITQKGIGYELAEKDTIGKFHGTPAFDIKTGKLLNPNNLPSYSEIISSYLLNYAKKDKDIIAITPGMSYGSKLEVFKEKLPNQYIDVGINEEHALIMANSLSLAGKKPFVFIYSTFLQRGYDALVHDIARLDGNVTLCIDRAGIVPGDGSSHQGIFDIPFMLSIPNAIISMPIDAQEANNLIYTSLQTKGLFAIRYPKTNIKYDFGDGKLLPVGSWELLNEGKDATIISYGDFCLNAMDVALRLKEFDINVNIVNARYIKPIDDEMFRNILKKNKPIFVYEESIESASLGAYLSFLKNKYESKTKLYTIGIKDEYLPVGTRDELIKMQNLDEEYLLKFILDTLGVELTYIDE